MAAVKIYQPLAGLMTERLGWQDHALCRGQDPETWFPPQGGDVITAKAICNSCPVMETCRAYAIDNHESYGVWGATSVAEREELWRGRPTRISDGRGGPPCQRLTDAQQTDVLNLLEQGQKVKPLARQFGVDEGVIRRLRDRHLKGAA